MKKIITLILAIASCIWAFNIKNLSDCTISKKHMADYNNWDEFRIKCHTPIEYEIKIDIMWHDVYGYSEYIYTDNGKKTDALYFDFEGNAYHDISEEDEYGVYVRMNSQPISTNKANKLLMKKWEYFKKLKRRIENNNKKIIYQKPFKEQSELKIENTDITDTNEYVPDGGWYSDNKDDCPPSWKNSDGTCKNEWFLD